MIKQTDGESHPRDIALRVATHYTLLLLSVMKLFPQCSKQGHFPSVKPQPYGSAGMAP